MLAEDFFNLYSRYNMNVNLALNIKADGLQSEMLKLINRYNITNYFVFDMSVCDTIGYIEKGLNVFSRKSEYEESVAFFRECKGIWYDMFDTEHFDDNEVINYNLHRKKVCLVSPELHGQAYSDIWHKYKELSEYDLLLCTDKPFEADAYFNGN
jgi:hypothetical protein